MPDNFVIKFFKSIGGVLHKSADYVADFSHDVFIAFLPLLKGEAAKFIAEFKSVALAVAVTVEQEGGTTKQKISNFATKIGIEFVRLGVHEVKDHLVNLLREVVVAEGKERGILK